MKRAQRPTVQRLLNLLAAIPVRVVRKTRDGVAGYWDGEKSVIVVALEPQPERADGLVSTVIHELLHAWYEVDHDDVHDRHEHVWPGEMEFFRSRALREAVMRRLLNSRLYGLQTEWRRVDQPVTTPPPPDPHAERRERKLRRRRYGMRMSGASVRLLERLMHASARALSRVRGARHRTG